MPPSESTMLLCDLLARVRSYRNEMERRLDEKCKQRGLELALADRKLETKHKPALRMLQRYRIDRHDLSMCHSATQIVLAGYEAKARNDYGEERFKQSGKSFKDFFFTPNVWDFCRQELVKVVPKQLTEKELDDYLGRIALRAIDSFCRASVELARLDQKGFTTKLLARILTEYPNDAKAMELSRPTTRDTTRLVETDSGVVSEDDSSAPTQTHAESSTEAIDASAKADTPSLGRAADRTVSPITIEPSGSVTVLGRPKMLTPAQFAVIKKMVEAFPDGLVKDELEAGGCGGARKTLKSLIKRDTDFARVISFPGQSGQGRGYRLTWPE